MKYKVGDTFIHKYTDSTIFRIERIQNNAYLGVLTITFDTAMHIVEQLWNETYLLEHFKPDYKSQNINKVNKYLGVK